MTTSPSTPLSPQSGARSPGMKFLIMMVAGFMLSIPILSIYLLNYDRQSRSKEARASIAEGWGGAQTVSGPILAIPYRGKTTEMVNQNGQQVERTREETLFLELAPEVSGMTTQLDPEKRKRSIYESVVYTAHHRGTARFTLPDDLADRGIPTAALQFAKAELRFGLTDMQGFAGTPDIKFQGQPVKLKPGNAGAGSGFHGAVDASGIGTGPLATKFAFDFRGNGMLTLRTAGGETAWDVRSTWQSPSFKGLLPLSHKEDAKGFTANWKIGGLTSGGFAQGNSEELGIEAASSSRVASPDASVGAAEARVDLFEPVDIYSQVERAVKYGFLFVGFTFIAFLMFDVIGGVRVSLIEYLLVGAGLVLFFIMLLAMSEVLGFGLAYTTASAAIIGLITAYSAAVLKSWARAKWIGGLLVGLYATLYTLLSLEDMSLLIGSLLLFVALAAIMYLTRNIDWGTKKIEEDVAA